MLRVCTNASVEYTIDCLFWFQVLCPYLDLVISAFVKTRSHICPAAICCQISRRNYNKAEGTPRKLATATQQQFSRIVISLSWTHVTEWSSANWGTADTRKQRGNAIVRRLACSVAWKLSFSVFPWVALPFPQFALLHSVTCVQLRLITILGNCGCVTVASFLVCPHTKRAVLLRVNCRRQQEHILYFRWEQWQRWRAKARRRRRTKRDRLRQRGYKRSIFCSLFFLQLVRGGASSRE
jgi:hypothetical protein